MKGSAYKTEWDCCKLSSRDTDTKGKKKYISNAWVSDQQGSRNPTKMGQLLVIRVKWKEINLECLHGKLCVWVAGSGCWIWGYEGMNHTSTCAWNTCGTFVQNLPKMPIRQIKVMERPPPSQSYPHKPLVRNIMKKTGFLVKFGYAWILLRFSQWDDSTSLP